MIKVRNILIYSTIILYVIINILFCININRTIKRIEDLELKINKVDTENKLYYQDIIELIEYKK